MTPAELDSYPGRLPGSEPAPPTHAASAKSATPTAIQRSRPGTCASSPPAMSCGGWTSTCRSGSRCGAGSRASAGWASSFAAPRCSSICWSVPASTRTASATVRCPTWINEQGEWVPGQINFTAEATPDQVGSGLRAINTLVPRGRPRRAFRQRRAEFAVLLAGVRAHVDGVRRDAVDVLRQPARRRGLADALRAQRATARRSRTTLIRDRIAEQPTDAMRSTSDRSRWCPYFESALYGLPDAALTAGDGAGAGTRDGTARARHGEPASDAGDSAPPQPGIGRVVPGVSARPHGGLSDARVFPARARVPDRQRRHRSRARRALLGARQQRRPRRHPAQPHRRGLLGPLPGRRVQPSRSTRRGHDAEEAMAAAATRQYSGELPRHWTLIFAWCTAPKCWPIRATARMPCARASRRGFASTIRWRSIESTAVQAALPRGPRVRFCRYATNIIVGHKNESSPSSAEIAMRS